MENGRDPATFQGLNPGGAEGAFGYDIPNLLIDHAMRNTHVPPWFWRGVNNNQNAIYLECFIDELAHAAGQDPLAFRRKMMTKHPKHLGGAQRGGRAGRLGQAGAAGRVPRHLPAHGLRQLRRGGGRNLGDGGNKIKMHRIVAATDCGHAVNPAQIERQIAGSFVYGLSALFHGGNHRQGRRASSRRTSTRYGSIRMAEMPKVESIIMPSGGFWGGVGEPTIFVAAPAVLNAYLRGDGQAHPLVPAEESQPADRVTTPRRSQTTCMKSSRG